MVTEKFEFSVPDELDNSRLDQVIARLCPEHSRSRLQSWIRSGHVTVDNDIKKQKDLVRKGQFITIIAEFEEQKSAPRQALPLNIVYEDDDILIINKAAGLVVHPGAGNPDQTLMNALLYHSAQLSRVPRAGIVHRLDKDTSGLMVVAKTPASHTYLVECMQQRHITRIYQGVVFGVLTSGGSVDAPIGRHPKQRLRMAVRENGKEAKTHYRVMKKFSAHTHVKFQLESGRTHQIRVHMAHILHPLVGDPVYAGRKRVPKDCPVELRTLLQQFPRQALHASQLMFCHPQSGEELQFESALPDDILHLLELLSKTIDE